MSMCLYTCKLVDGLPLSTTAHEDGDWKPWQGWQSFLRPQVLEGFGELNECGGCKLIISDGCDCGHVAGCSCDCGNEKQM